MTHANADIILEAIEDARIAIRQTIELRSHHGHVTLEQCSQCSLRIEESLAKIGTRLD